MTARFKILILLVYSSFSYSNILDDSLSSDDYISLAKKRCSFSTNPNTSPYVTIKDFAWNLGLNKLISLSKKLYHSDKTLYDRIYYNSDEKSFKLPVRLSENKVKNIDISESFILKLISHIETALEKNYAEEINYADMGHSHFLIPKDYFKKISTKNQEDIYKNIFASPETLFVYHTAEQLDTEVKKIDGTYHLPEDDYLKHRYLTRNLIGYNNNSKQLDVIPMRDLTSYNTFGISNIKFSKYSEYEWYGAGYYMSANHQGCFPFKKEGDLFYFDISLEGPDSHYINHLNLEYY